MSSDEVGLVADKRPSISDVAAVAGVSKAAVSKVLRSAYGVSPAMRERVESAIDQLGYRPRTAARAMRGSSYTIGLEIPQLGNDFFMQLMEGAIAALAESAYQLILMPALNFSTGTSVINALVDRQVDGIVAVSSAKATPDWSEQLVAPVPVVLIGGHRLSENFDSVTGNDSAGADLAMDHLFDLGHRRIAHLTTRESDLAPQSVRLKTYHRRMAEAGFAPQVAYTSSDEHEAYLAARGLLTTKKPPTAIFAGHDVLAMGVLRATAELGMDDISVVGYDNIPIADHPLISLTTVDQFGVEMGTTAIELLMNRIRDGRTSPQHHETQPELRIRRSSKPAPSPRPNAKP
jgi:LacI family transcriptional regulator, galactose operon repressor